jgi:hypothetical protein
MARKFVTQDNVHNSVILAETLLQINIKVCGTITANRGIPRGLEENGKCLKKWQPAFWKKGDIMV